MKHLFLFFFIYISLNCLAQDKIFLSEKANALHMRMSANHVLKDIHPDTLGNRFNKIMLRLLDPQHVIFTASDKEKLHQLALGIQVDFKEKKTRYYSEISNLYQKGIASLEKEQTALNTVPLDLNWNVQLTDAEEARFHDDAGRLMLWKKQFYVLCFDRMFDKKYNPEQLSKDSLNFYEKETRSFIGKNRLDYLKLIKSDNSILDQYYLMAYTLSYDPHSMYMSPEIRTSFFDPLTAEKERFGFSYGVNDANDVVITEVLPGSPVWLSGEIQVNDILVRVGFFDEKKWTFLDVEPGIIGMRKLLNVLQSYEGKQLILVVKDKFNEEIEVSLVKDVVYNDDEIVKNALYSGENKIGYIYLPDFYTNYGEEGISQGCASDIAKCILKLKKDNIHGLVLDLRGNGGGSLLEAIALIGVFIDYGPVGAQMDKDGTVQVFKDLNRGMIYDGPLMVLVDEGSASASEIVAAALQDYNKALVVGRQTFGKATAQLVLPLDPLALTGYEEVYNPDYGFANITQNILYRITGESNQARGVLPDIVIGNPVDHKKLDVEANEIGAIVAPVCPKKITYSKSLIPLPVSALRENAQLIHNEPRLSAYYTLLDSLIASERDFVRLNYRNYYQERKQLVATLLRLENEMEHVAWHGTLSSNTFDQSLYEKNPVLDGFYKEFLKKLTSDFELFEAMELMEKWLSLNNK